MALKERVKERAARAPREEAEEELDSPTLEAQVETWTREAVQVVGNTESPSSLFCDQGQVAGGAPAVRYPGEAEAE